jgi:hypothetical protein
MKLQHVPLADIISNPWRDKTLYPISDEQIAGLRTSIKDHEFFASLKGRRRNGKVEIGCGHARLEAAKKAHLDTIPIFIADLDDDQMLRLMTDENATQSGANAGAIMNEAAAVIRRLIEGLAVEPGTIVHRSISCAFEGRSALGNAQERLNKRLNNPNADIPIGINTIRMYLGQGDPKRCQRPERAIREAISALKQCGKYDEIVEKAVVKARSDLPVPKGKPSKSTAVIMTEPRAPRRRILDERCAAVFTNDHQFHAFREAVTTHGAQKVIPVDEQLTLAKSIMKNEHTQKKDRTATYVKKMVQVAVQDGLKAQRNIDKEEQERYLREQAEERIKEQLDTARMYVRSLGSALAKIIDLADEFPHHPMIGGFSASLDSLVNAIQQLSRKLKGKET